MSRTTQFRADQSGASATEFALFSPIIAVLLFGVIEFGFILYGYSATQSAARDVARRLATNQLSTAQASATLKQELPSWMANGATVSVSQSNPADYSKNQMTVDVSLPASVAAITGVLSWAYSGINIHVAVTMQQEQSL